VSENDNYHCPGFMKVAVKSHWKERLKRKALRRLRKTDIQGADMICWALVGRLCRLCRSQMKYNHKNSVELSARLCRSDTNIHTEGNCRVPLVNNSNTSVFSKQHKQSCRAIISCYVLRAQTNKLGSLNPIFWFCLNCRMSLQPLV